MRTYRPKSACLLLNLGGFELRMHEHVTVARRLGRTLFSLTGDGLVKVEEGAHAVPANVLALSPAELRVWSAMINEQLRAAGFAAGDAIILAAGRRHRGTLPLGTFIGCGIQLGA
ncbi:hypothetical protein SAMN02799624_00695 [Paenibacillus sp. UNC496MF]|uniref:hypothetical protein n=1 Tax=Paenibacillus sp. UNC496MF TaxID=1502753 RepID=UPI0008EE8277|nr:hypothetical protein [Paenibacillus sp. UNC496MF]SFI37868.1 hypothetical protein SAMN02799624_00695 [Paenibacillus sp. UNC496MF]